jgi:hypothetical protein
MAEQNQVDALRAERFATNVQDYLNEMLVSDKIASMELEAMMTDAYRVNKSYTTDVVMEDYEPLTDLAFPATVATNEYLEADQIKATGFRLDKVQTVAQAAKQEAQQSYQVAFQMRNSIDQHCLNTINDAVPSVSEVSGGSLSASTIFGKITDLRTAIAEQDAFDGVAALVMDPARVALLDEYLAGTGNNVADTILRNGFAGKIRGFEVYESTNLPYSVALTIDAQPTAGDTITIKGVVFTWTAASSASAAGEVSIGADKAAAQANLVNAVNGTGTTGDNTYIALGTADKGRLRNKGVAISAFNGSDIATITGAGKINGAETFTAGTNVFGTETTQILGLVKGAVDVARLLKPEIDIRKESRNFGKNHMGRVRYGAKVFHRNTFRTAKITCNA